MHRKPILPGQRARPRAKAGGGGVSRARLSLAMLAATAGMLLATAMLALQCGDAYATAAYFHPPRETVVAWTTGFALCQSIALVGSVVPASRSLGAAAKRGRREAYPLPVRRAARAPLPVLAVAQNAVLLAAVAPKRIRP